MINDIIKLLCIDFKGIENKLSRIETAFELEQEILKYANDLANKMTNQLLGEMGSGYSGNAIRIDGKEYQFKGNRTKELHGLFGIVKYTRAHYADLNGGEGYYPLDKKLGITKKQTPACQYHLTSFTGREAYQESLDRFHEIFRPKGNDYISVRKALDMDAEIGEGLSTLREKEIATVFKGERIPVVDEIKRMAVAIDATKIREVTEIRKRGKKVKQIEYRDAKIASISELGWDRSKQEAVCLKTSYVSAIEYADDFFKRILAEMNRRTKNPDKIELVVLADGAPWIWDRVSDISNYKTTQILDYYHACEHLSCLCKTLYSEGTELFKKMYRNWKEKLIDGKICILIQKFKRIRDTVKGLARTEVQKQIDYFEANKNRMHYDKYRSHKLPIGSGTIESACKNVIGSRMKQGGMSWSFEGAQGMLQIRSSLKSSRFLNDFKIIRGLAA